MAGIYILMLVVLCNMMALRGSKIVVSLFAIDLGASQFVIGIIVALYSLLPMLLALYAGKLTDRLGMRTPVVAGSIGMAAGLLLPGLLPGMTMLCISATAIGAAHVFYNVSMQKLVGMISSKEDRARNYSNYALAMSLGGFIGPMTTGFAIDSIGYTKTYLFLALLPLLPALIMAFLKLKLDPSAAVKGEGEATRAFGLLANKPLRRVLVVSAIMLTGIDLLHFYMPIYGHSIGLSASKIGIILSMFAAAAFVVRLWMPMIVRRVGEDNVLTLCLFVSAATYLVMPLFDSAVLLAVIAFMLGLGTGCGQPLTLMLIYNRSPDGRSGEALGLRLTINHFTHMLVPMLFGAIGTAFGVAPVFLINSLMLVGGGILSRRK